MFFRRAIAAALLVTAAAAAGCGPKAVKRACMGGSTQSSLVSDAQMVRLDVYGPAAECADGVLVAGAGSPILSHTYGAGQPIALDVPPGPHTLVLSTFSDSDGTQLLGIGCTQATLTAGSEICFDLTIEPAPDGGDDLSGALCSTVPDDCPAGSYCNGLACAPGCKSDSECPKSDAGLGVCDKTTHMCSDCSVNSDCGTAPGAACCNKRCVNTKSDLQNCNGCNVACTGASTLCCNGTCSNPSTDPNNCGGCGKACSTVNATPSCGGGVCGWTCNSGFGHCASGNTGCETNLPGANEKLCGNLCIAQTSCCSSADCATPPAPGACYKPGVCSGVGGSCAYALKTGSVVCGASCCNAINGSCNGNCTLSCTSGFADCNGDPSDGCETNLATAGKKLCNGACIATTACCTASDCNTPPAPATCYSASGTCPTPGGACMYTENGGSQICGATCCNATHGTCSGTCTLQCASGFFDCDSNVADGCETACAPANASGGCVGGGCGIASCNSGWLDCDASAANGCECNTSCCTNPITSAQGCTVNSHGDGYGHSFSACYPLGVPGTAGTPGTGYAARVATDAATADVTQLGSTTIGLFCTTGTEQVTSACKQVSGSKECTCWAYAATSGNCKDPQDNVSKPCTSFIGHTFHSLSTCPCVSVTDSTYQ